MRAVVRVLIARGRQQIVGSRGHGTEAASAVQPVAAVHPGRLTGGIVDAGKANRAVHFWIADRSPENQTIGHRCPEHGLQGVHLWSLALLVEPPQVGQNGDHDMMHIDGNGHGQIAVGQTFLGQRDIKRRGTAATQLFRDDERGIARRLHGRHVFMRKATVRIVLGHPQFEIIGMRSGHINQALLTLGWICWHVEDLLALYATLSNCSKLTGVSSVSERLYISVFCVATWGPDRCGESLQAPPYEDKHAKQEVVAHTHGDIPMGKGKIEAFGMPGDHIPDAMRKARERKKHGTHP